MNVSFIHEYDLLLPQWNEQWYSMIRLTWPIFLLSLLVSATLLVFFPLFTIIYQAFERQKANYLLQTSLHLLESYWKWFGRTSVQRWCNIVTLPGFSYVLPAPADILTLQLYYEIWKLIWPFTIPVIITILSWIEAFWLLLFVFVTWFWKKDWLS